ncbi:Eco57I restriction-modification methylase domain-containing protein, partial [Streptacidiphilus jiangxiensis]
MPEASPLSGRSCERLVQQLGGRAGTAAAVSWAHAVAVARHAATHGLLDTRLPEGADETLRLLDQLAGAHPALAGFGDPQVVTARTSQLTAQQWGQANAFWAQTAVTEDRARMDGYVLGDAYQALSAEARASRALCQTPPWVARLLLDLALEPAIEEVGPGQVRMIDPSCGTGHILVAAFHHVRAFAPRGRAGGWPAPAHLAVERALRAVSGVDLDPYAALLTRYRLLAGAAVALRCRLDQVPRDWAVQVASADALLDEQEPLLLRGQYDAVVGNPPYIAVRDSATRDRIRRRYAQVCSGKYSLALPFFALMTDLARPGGHIAQLTANSFMKREFGKKFVEQYLPALDLTWVIDSSGAYI